MKNIWAKLILLLNFSGFSFSFKILRTSEGVLLNGNTSTDNMFKRLLPFKEASSSQFTEVRGNW